MARALITGGSGFIGSAIVKELIKRGDQVVVFDKNPSNVPGVENLFGDITDQARLLGAVQGIDEVYHVAGVLGTTELLDQPELAINSNINGTLYALKAAVSHGASRFLYPTKPNDWLNAYSITKATGEEFCRLYRKFHGLDTRILRWLNAYGPGQKLYPVRKAVPLFILQALQNLPIEIWGDGSQKVDLIHIDDLAFITVDFTKTKVVPIGLLDTGLTWSVSVRDLANLIIALTQSSSTLRFLPMRLGEESNVPISLLPTATDYLGTSRTAIPLKDGLEETILFYKRLPSNVLNSALEFYYGTTEGLGPDSLTTGGRQQLAMPLQAA